ncbi:bifunctional 4-hydroxy-2-oxoglutarate aldolase/2-dehydro-3-deoxy-phosphogluconate aldolase [Methylobacterium nodulans]|uniref:2-dehydro-3-deoxy-phosphogluconate aldolase n=1 Tax=Methylobacterium nodulans (strain LMG 21967 / CNCM I-2342 / ORS 2060) TaxID=460265 RepID=B8ID20_METNO|nr:bifunctional 4-hydroxy-2-oxoglutarate aldolase/2-dehydro-3-deoxy-phosphogluconate aldolase [Methylobacterium nodulans]ACL59412.1 2-dehydro-3-deoxyphosphogluconate aldolase/4-hydroxy-2-oxoglutarate aldolase [Methylobacterium nodulans ORS 2060]
MTSPAESRLARLDALLTDAPVIPVITVPELAQAVPLARALVAGGIRTLEITLRTPVARDAARAIIAEVPEAVVGIGTVLTPHDLQAAHDLGARFALSPGATPELLREAAASDMAFMPGIATPSELMQVLEAGFRIAKFFPAVPAGGQAALKALAGPFPQARFCPTGGIGEADAKAWLALPNVVAVGGSWLAPEAEIRAGRFEAITERARRTLAGLA